MNPLEDRLRTSLRAHADAVEPSQELWRETNRRIDRRARRRTIGWSMAGVATAAAAVFGVVVVAGLGPELPVPEVAGVPDSEDPGDATDPGEDAAESTDPDTARDDGDGADRPWPQLTASATALELRDPDGAIVDQLVLPAEGESSILSLAVQPGSTPDALSVALLTEAEGMVDLRVVRRDADGFTIAVVAPAYRPSSGVDPRAVSGPAFSPDGTSLAWLEGGPAPTLRTIGWDDDGPGTGPSATDNAAFTLDDVVAPLQLHDWVVHAEPDGFVLRAREAASTSWSAIPLVRQADGAWAREPGAGVDAIDAPDDLETVGRTARLEDGAVTVPVR